MICPTCKGHYAESLNHCPRDGAALRRRARKTTREFRVDPFVGKVFDDRYRIDHRIGEGRVGVVYAGHHVNLDKRVAIKVLRREMSGDSGAVQRFSQEARAASRVGHPAIADVTDFGEHQQQVYLVMEYLEGQTLEQALRDEGRFHLARALDVARQVARGVHAAHLKGVIHRDLKPANIFLRATHGGAQRIKILDFGLAKISLQPRTTMLGAFMGTPEYVAPELAAGRETDKRVDVYSLGVILYEMISGRVPFRGDTPTKTLAMHIEEAIPPFDASLNVPERLTAIVWQALRKEPRDRFASLAALDGALGAVESRLAPPPEAREAAAPPEGATILAAPLAVRASAAPKPLPPRPMTADATHFRGPSAWAVAAAMVVASLVGTGFGAWLARSQVETRGASAAAWAGMPPAAVHPAGQVTASPARRAARAATPDATSIRTESMAPPATRRDDEMRPRPPDEEEKSSRAERPPRRREAPPAAPSDIGSSASETPAATPPGLMPFPRIPESSEPGEREAVR